ncbi:MAG: hypothetical protein E2585_05835 [Comamonas sp.]|nr:hypothetical protein [Comamonas sp.]
MKTACTGSTPKPANAPKSKLPLSGCAASPSLATREGDDTFAARRLLLGVSEMGCASSHRRAQSYPEV